MQPLAVLCQKRPGLNTPQDPSVLPDRANRADARGIAGALASHRRSVHYGVCLLDQTAHGLRDQNYWQYTFPTPAKYLSSTLGRRAIAVESILGSSATAHSDLRQEWRRAAP